VFIKILKLFLALIITGCATLIATGFSAHRVLSPLEHHGLFQKISGDRWIQEGATISLPHLSERGNFVTFNFNNWHPGNQPPAEASIKVCGELASAFIITPGQSQKVFLRGACVPRNIEIHFKNPFNPSPTDARLVGAQLSSIEVSSKLGLPIADLKSLAIVFGALLTVSLFTAYLFSQKLRPIIYIFTTLIFTALISGATRWNYSLWLPVWVVWTLGLLGAALIGGEKSELRQKNQPSRYWIFGVLVLGAFIRFWGLDFGLPHIYHPDEFQKYKAVMRMVEHGDLNPRYFWHPSLLLYATYGMNSLMHLLFINGEFTSTIILAGRTVSCLAGIISIFFVYKIGELLWNRRAGLLASLLLGTFPLAVTCSRYLKEDSLLTSIVLGATLLTVQAAQTGSLPRLLAAGLVAGLSSSVKYSGIISFFIIWGYPFLCRNSSLSFLKRVKHSIFATILVPVGFLVGTPYSILDYPTFINDFNHERQHMLSGHSSVITAASQYWMFHIKNSLLKSMTPLNLVFAIIALGGIIRLFRFPALYLIGLIFLYYLPAEFVRAKPAPQPERYIMPCLPFLALAVSWLYEQLKATPKSVNSALSIMILTGIAFSAYRSITLAYEISPDTRDQAAQWLAQNVKPQEKVIVDWEQYGPQFKEPPFALEYLDPNTVMMDLVASNLKSRNGDYLVLSSLHYDRYFSQPNMPASLRALIRSVKKSYPIIKEFAPKYGTYGFNNPKISILRLSPNPTTSSENF
jgi:uncharacterized membrane protein